MPKNNFKTIKTSVEPSFNHFWNSKCYQPNNASIYGYEINIGTIIEYIEYRGFEGWAIEDNLLLLYYEK